MVLISERLLRIEHRHRLAGSETVMRQRVGNRSMGAHIGNLAHWLKRIQIEHRDTRIGFPPRDVQPPPGLVSENIIKPAFTANLDGLQYLVRAAH